MPTTRRNFGLAPSSTRQKFVSIGLLRETALWVHPAISLTQGMSCAQPVALTRQDQLQHHRTTNKRTAQESQVLISLPTTHSQILEAMFRKWMTKMTYHGNGDEINGSQGSRKV